MGPTCRSQREGGRQRRRHEEGVAEDGKQRGKREGQGNRRGKVQEERE